MNIAFVGCGGMAAHYLHVYRDLDWVRVVCCVDADASAAQCAASQCDSDATTDFSAALSPKVDAVVISTPNHLHRLQAVAAMEAGKHVLLQKPVAANLPDARAIAAAAAQSTKTVGLYMSYFDQPLVYDLHEMIAQGRLGSLVHFYARLMHRGGMMWSQEALKGNRTWRSSVEETGGGCFIQLAVHYVHLFSWFAGTKVVRVTALSRNLHCPGLEGEDLAVAVLEMDSGAMATLDMAWCANGEELAIHGTEGRAIYRNASTLDVASTAGEFHGRVIHYTGGVTPAFGGPTGVEQRMEVAPPAFSDIANPWNQHRAFLEAARDGRPAFVPVATGVEDLRVVAAVYESARRGRAINMDRQDAPDEA
jgi:UDP-N-acetyl-2-amino-2-deoxyglucuronate dehydrogenase